MASTGTGGTLPPNFLLTPQQQNLLFAALNSNKQQLSGSSADNSLTVSPTTFRNSAGQQKSATATGYQESPFLDNYDYDFGDSGFDFSFASEDQPSMIGDLPAASTEPNNNSGSVALSDSPETDTPEKPATPTTRMMKIALVEITSAVRVPTRSLRSPVVSLLHPSPAPSARLKTGLPSVLSENARRST